MKLLLKKINQKDLEQARNYFTLDYLQNLKNKQKESIIARYYISLFVKDIFWIENFEPKIDKTWKPIFENNIYWSISHKKDLILIWVGKEKIWLDVEIFKEKDSSLLDFFKDKEYNLLWWKNWENFYILWTGKESLIKYNLWKLDDMQKLVLEKVVLEKNIIDWLTFDKILVINWKKVFSGKKNIIYWLLCKSFKDRNI